MSLSPEPLTCPECFALVAIEYLDRHLERAHGYRPAASYRGDDAPTTELPPIGQTIRRRPPVPPPAVVRELEGAELLRAIAAELEKDARAELRDDER